LVEHGLFESIQALGRTRRRAFVGVTLFDPSSDQSGWLDVLSGCLLTGLVKQEPWQA